MHVATPEEQKILSEVAKAKEAGLDPFGDDDEDDVLAAEDGQDGADNADDADGEQSAEKPEDGSATDDAGSDDAGNTQASEEPERQTYTAQVPAEYKEQRGELLKSKAEAMKKLMDGEIDAEEYAAEDSRISDALEELAAQRIRAETLIEANKQAQEQYQGRAIRKLIEQSKSQIDYMADAKAQKQFDTALQSLGADPDNASKDYAELIQEAHRVVCAIRGVPLTKGEQVAAAISKTRGAPANAPVTLRGLPSASTPNANGSILDQMARLKGDAYQQAFAKLSPAQRRQLLDEE